MGSGGGSLDVVSVYMGGTHGSVVLSSACDVLEMSVVRGVGGVCDMYMCLALGRVESVGVRALGLGFTNPGGTGGKWDMCRCFDCSCVLWCGWCWMEWRLVPGSGRVLWCYVCVCCESGLFVLMAGPGICILC